MKYGGSLHGPGPENRIKDDEKTLDALAIYFARYVEEYEKEGIQIGMVMPQNLPNMSTNYTSCLWTGVQLSKFIGHHLGPVFENRGLPTEIYLGTINDDNDRGGYAYLDSTWSFSIYSWRARFRHVRYPPWKGTTTSGKF